jgi:hypothetical protein
MLVRKIDDRFPNVSKNHALIFERKLLNENKAPF